MPERQCKSAPGRMGALRVHPAQGADIDYMLGFHSPTVAHLNGQEDSGLCALY